MVKKLMKQAVIKPKINIEIFINTRCDKVNISCKSHIVTVFGDVISQHGGWVWLGSLIDSLQPLGFSERLIRTSVFRLVKDDWLTVNKIGRKSFYAFTDTANKHYTKAAKRIYANELTHTDNNWLILMPVFVPDDKMILLKRQLQWLGFSLLSSASSGVFAHPSIDPSSLNDTIKELQLSNAVIVFTSRTLNATSEKVLKRLVYEKWQINELQSQYQLLIKHYQPVLNLLDKGQSITDQQSYLLRSLLIHEYRRVLLRDYELPQSLLPDNWLGFQAGQLVNQLYNHLASASCRFINNQLENKNGYLPKAINSFKDRF